jgi:hypothetical protein
VEAYNGEAKSHAKRQKKTDRSTAMSGKILAKKNNQFSVSGQRKPSMVMVNFPPLQPKTRP